MSLVIFKNAYKKNRKTLIPEMESDYHLINWVINTKQIFKILTEE